MKSLLLALSITIFTGLYPVLSSASNCKGPVINVNMGSLSMFSPTINLNGTLRIFTGTKEAEVVDIFTSTNEAFSGFTYYVERVDDKDLRNWFFQKIFPRDLKPSEYYINFSLNDSGMEVAKAKRNLQLTLSLRVGGQTRNGSVIVSPDPSWNCK